MNSTVDLRNRIGRGMDDERRALGMIPMTDLCAARDAYAETHDATPRIGSGLYWGADERPLTRRRDWPEIVGGIIAALVILLVAALCYWAAARGMGGA